jgi:hypothetical protein
VPVLIFHGVNIGTILGNCTFIGHGALADRCAPARVFILYLYFAARIETEELESENNFFGLDSCFSIDLTEGTLEKLQNVLRKTLPVHSKPKKLNATISYILYEHYKQKTNS